MHSSLPVSRALRSCAALLLVAAVATSCHEGPTDPLTRVQRLQPVDSALQVKAGTQSLVKVLVLDASGDPVAGVSVNWEASSGYLARTATSSDANGVAVNEWTALGELGAVQITASVGAVQPLKFPVEVVPGYATRLSIVEDSLHFTAQWQARTVRVVGVDNYGHPLSLAKDIVQLNGGWAQVWAATTVGDTTVVTIGSGFGTHRWYFVLGTSDGRTSDSVLVVLAPVVVRTEISGLDSANGLAVGEHVRLQVTGVDSSGYTVTDLDSARSRLQLSTSDANVASVADDGTVTAVAPGTVTIGASAPGAAYRRDITVYPVFDAGTATGDIELHDPNAYSQTPLGHYLTDAGTLYDLSHYVGAGALPHPEGVVLRASAADGKALWTRVYPTSDVAVVADPASGIAYLGDHLHVIHAIDPGGTDRWSFDYGAIDTGMCRLAGWKDGVAAACGTHVFALDGSGSLSWSATVSDSVQQVISTPTLSVLRMNSSVAAITGNGSIAWTLASAATDMIADADGTVYLVENGVRAIDISGVERWHNATPLAGCVLATSDKLVVCRNNSVITALDRSNGQVRWSTTAPASYGNAAAISGDRILLSGAFIFALDARTGAVLGRTLDPVGEYDLSVGNGVMAAASFSSALLFRTPFSPGSEWAQSAGNAGRGNRVSP